MTPFVVWFLSTLAAYRLWQLLARDDLPGVAEVRAAIDRAADERSGLRRYVDAIYCPWCLGWWCVVVVFVAVDLVGVSVPLPLVQIAAASTVVGLIGGKLDG